MSSNYPVAPTSLLEAVHPLETPGGGRELISSTTETAISVQFPAKRGHLRRIEAICTISGTTPGNMSLRRKEGSAVFNIVEFPVTPVAGNRFTFEAPSPIPTEGAGDRFSIQFSVGTMGTWAFFINGFAW